MMLTFDEPVSAADLDALVADYKYGRYLEDRSLPGDGAKRLVLANLQSLLARGESRVIAARSPGGKIEGILVFHHSEWDGSHFGFPVAAIDAVMLRGASPAEQHAVAGKLLEGFSSCARAGKVRFTSLRIPTMDLPVVHALEDHGFRFIESWIYNTRDLSRLTLTPDPASTLRFAHRSDMDTMLEFSRGAFAVQRFHADWNIDRAKADSLYRKWIETSFDDPNQRIVVMETEGSAKAFMVYYHSDLRGFVDRQFAMWKMLLLDPDSRGKGVGTQFLSAVAAHHRKEGMDAIDSGLTLRNLPSLNLHNKCEFKIVCVIATFHRWFDV